MCGGGLELSRRLPEKLEVPPPLKAEAWGVQAVPTQLNSWKEKNDTIVFILSFSIISFYHIMLNSGSFLFIDLRRAL